MIRRVSSFEANRRPPSDSLIELGVERLGAGGDGIAQHGGEPVFLPFTVPGDRAAPPCPHFGYCGGCALQHLDPASYRAFKLGVLHTALERVGIDPGVVQSLRVVPPVRRRAQLGLIRPRDPRLPARVGFHERFRHELVDLRECLVLEPALFSIVYELRVIACDLVPPSGAAEVTLTRTDSGVDMLLEAAQRPGLGVLEALAALAEKCDLARVVWRLPAEEVLVVERRPVRVVFSGIAVPFPSGGFLQASAAAEAILIEEVVGGIGPSRPVLDLYAGLGTFTFALAAGGAVHAVEGDEDAVVALTRVGAGHPNVSVERRDLACNPLRPEELAAYTAAVFDPPRIGAINQATELANSTIATIVAVSCNPATFARDAARLIAGGLHLERIVPVDQFVWTPHLELAATFRR